MPNLSNVLMLLGCLLVLVGCDALPSTSQQPPANQPTTLVLHYNDSSVVIRNAGENPMAAPSRLSFVRGAPDADGDDYSGSRITAGALAPGQCYTLVRRGSQALDVSNCEVNTGTEIMTNVTGLFWKAEPVRAEVFQARWDETILAECNTYSLTDTGTQLCTFVYPPEEAD